MDFTNSHVPYAMHYVLCEGLAPPEAFRPRGLQPRAIAALPTQLEPTAGFEPAT